MSFLPSEDLCLEQSDRAVIASTEFYVESSKLICSKGNQYKTQGNGVIKTYDNYLSYEFTGKAGSYDLKVPLNHENLAIDGVSLKFNVKNWKSIRYVAVGIVSESGFQHIKIPNISQSNETTISFAWNDIAFLRQNEWQRNLDIAKPQYLRIFVSGEPSERAQISFIWASLWQESKTPISLSNGSDSLDVSKRLKQLLIGYFASCNLSINEQVQNYLNTGRFPVADEKAIEWRSFEALPTEHFDSGTYRYYWHSMQLPISLMVYAQQNDVLSPIFSARDFINDWIERSFINIDKDEKYTWYDHGTAERLMAFLLLYQFGKELDFDFRCMTRLEDVILKHARLLESESFYCCHQRTRYHNHAWFQDLSLIATYIMFPEFKAAKRWLKTGIHRLQEQFDYMLVFEKGYAISIENSMGYHRGVKRIVDFSASLLALTTTENVFENVSEKLERWSKFLCYPDGRMPTFGDTFRKPNNKKAVSFKPYQKPSADTFPTAGYSLIKGNHDSKPFMLCFVAPSITETHKHQDNLSFSLWFDGIEWLIDPSFYSHEYEKEIPAYLRSVWAHNTIAIEELDYSIAPGKASLRDRKVDEKGRFKVEGISNAYDKVTHNRMTEGRLDQLAIKITDYLYSEFDKTLPAWSLLHFGEGVEVELIGESILLSHHLSDKLIKIDIGSKKPTIVKGFVSSRNFQGVSGNGFMKSVGTQTAGFKVNNNRAVINITALDK